VENTAVHEHWHATQYANNPGWYGATYTPLDIFDPAEFTQAGQPFVGAHNFGFRLAPATPLSEAVGTAGAVLENASDQP
jgi:hypothetical protein